MTKEFNKGKKVNMVGLGKTLGGGMYNNKVPKKKLGLERDVFGNFNFISAKQLYMNILNNNNRIKNDDVDITINIPRSLSKSLSGREFTKMIIEEEGFIALYHKMTLLVTPEEKSEFLEQLYGEWKVVEVE